MAKSCSIIPLIEDAEGIVVDSILFTDLLSYAKNDRVLAKRIYMATKSIDTANYPKDVNGELTLDAAVQLYNAILANDPVRVFMSQNKIKISGRDLYKGSLDLKKLRNRFPEFIFSTTTTDSGYTIEYVKNPDYKDTKVNILNNRKQGLQATINRYTTKKKGNINDKEVFFLKTHQKIIKAVHSLNNDIKELTKEFKQKQKDSNLNIKGIIDNYINYNNGVYDEGYKNSPLYIEEIDRFDTVQKNYDNAVEEIEAAKTSLKENIADLENDDILDYEAAYMDFALKELERIKETDYNYDSLDNQLQLAEDFNFVRLVIDSHDIIGLKDLAELLSMKLLVNLGNYTNKLAQGNLNTGGLPEGTNIDVEAILNDKTDISTLSLIFEGFGDYARIETQLIHSITMTAKEKARLKSLETGKKMIGLLKNLEDWGVKNGKYRIGFTKNLKKGSLRQIYALLVEVSNTNRLDLVKPYTNEYYSLVNKYFRQRYSKDSTNVQKAEARKWLKDNHYNPVKKSIYDNPKYTYIQQHKELKEFYEFFKDSIAQGYSQLPEYVGTSNKEKIPSMMRNSVWEFLNLNDGNNIKSIWLGIKTLLLPSGRPVFYDEQGNVGKNFHLNELNENEVKIRMIGEIEPDLKSFDLAKILYEFVSYTNDYGAMSKVLPNVRMIQNIAKTKRYQKSNSWDPTGLTSRIGKPGDSRTVLAIDMYIKNKVLSGNEEGTNFGKIPIFSGTKIKNNENEVIGEQNFYFSDVLRGFIKYTRILTLGYNPFSAINNVAAGMVSDVIAASGKDFSKRDLFKAILIYTNNITIDRKNQLLNVQDSDSKTALLIDFIQPLQEMGEWQDHKKIDMGSATIVGDLVKGLGGSAFLMQEWGEHFVQTITMIAYLNKVKTPAGNRLWDMIYVEDGVLKFKAEDGVNIKELVASTREKIVSINNSSHGNYSKDNSSVFENNLLFQAGMVFKKWLPYQVRNRFMSERYNYRTGEIDKGFYLSTFDGISKILQNTLATVINSLKSGSNNLMTKKDLTEKDFEGMRKMLSEAVLLMTFMAISKIMAPPPDDEDDEWYIPDFWEHLDISMWDSKKEFNNTQGVTGMIIKSLMDSSNRLQGEMMQFYSPKFYYSDVYARHALWTSSQNIISFFTDLGNTLFTDDPKKEKFQKGYRKGQYRLQKSTPGIIPYIRQIDKAMNDGNKTMSELNHNLKK